MVGRRVALLVATDRYQDTGLNRLAAPASDAEQLAAVLRNIRIADFEVTTLYNEPNYVVGRAIGDFYRDRRRDDLTLLYFTGHGVKDDDGNLYLAMTDTDRENLQFTGVQCEQIRAVMEVCRSQQKVLVLDCCYAGAFPLGLGIKGDPAVHALEQLGGRGCVVLTSSDAMQLSFEGNQVTEMGPASQRSGPSSLFTRFLIEGLRTGNADLNGDGDITLDELYSYVHDRVTDEQPLQRPKKKEDIEGRIYFAQNIHWTLPSRISDAVKSPYAPMKLSALEELRSLHYRGNATVKQHVLETVRALAGDDSKSVSGAASQFLSELIPQEERRQAEEAAQREAEETARRQAEETAQRQAEETARRQAEEAAQREAEETARRQAEEAAQREAEETARRQAEEAAQRQAEETARRQAEETAQRQAEETARRQAEEAAQRQAEETARRQAEEAAQRQAEETARRQAEEAAQRQAEETARRQAEEAAQRQAEETARRQAEEAAQRQAEETAATVDPVPGSGPADGAEMPAAVLVTGSDRPGGVTDDDARTLAPTATAVAGEGTPAAVATATAEGRPTGDLGTAAGSAEQADEPGWRTAVADAIADAPDILTADQRGLSDLDSLSDRPPPAQYPRRNIVHRPSTTAVWIGRHRLIALALTCAILGAAGAISFVLTSSAKSPNSTNATNPTGLVSPANPTSPANPPSYSRVVINLPAQYKTNTLVSSLAFNRSGTTLAIAQRAGICLWDAATVCNNNVNAYAWSVAFSPNGKTLATDDGTSGVISLWNVAAQQQTAPLTDPRSKGVTSVAFSLDGKILAAGDLNGSTYLWDVATHQQTAPLPDPQSKGVTSVAFSLDGKILAAGDLNGSTYLWDVATHQQTAPLPDPQSKGVTSVAFSLDGKILAAGDLNGSTYLWDVATHQRIAPLPDPQSKGVTSVAFSSDGTLAAGDGNGSTYLWDVATHQRIAALPDPQSKGVTSVAFRPDSKTLATGDEDGLAYLWYARLRVLVAVISMWSFSEITFV